MELKYLNIKSKHILNCLSKLVHTFKKYCLKINKNYRSNIIFLIITNIIK
jgi:hypothetical protein